MKVSESWLREWVNPALDVQQLAEQLTMAGLEVDGMMPVAGDFNQVVVARVIQTTPHPEADKLTLCQIEHGSHQPIQVVCGARNVRTGLTVALALPGAKLPGDIIIKESMLRGQLSQGMLCSTSELGMDIESSGILELPEDAPLGVDLRDYLALNDHVLEINLTPNRPDCLSILGLAREIAAHNQLTITHPKRTEVAPLHDDVRKVTLHALDACPRYCGRIIRNIDLDAKTPFWMQERLRRSDIRCIHPVVDVMNYVMLELGQPMHAFDLKTICGQVHVRYARAEESCELLDGQCVTLKDNVLVIADDESVLAMAGIMGGEQSAVHEGTRDIFLESAFFSPQAIAGVGRRYGLSSESSQRFERGVDPTLQRIALERATELLQSIVGGEVGPVIEASDSAHLPSQVSVEFSPEKVKRYTGLVIPEETMFDALTRLGMTINKQAPLWLVHVPPYRFDIHLDIDLVEEVIRIYGYQNIQGTTASNAPMTVGNVNDCEALVVSLASFFCDRGYHEAISYSFVDPNLQSAIHPNEDAIQLVNPISSELSQMRVSLWPGLLASMVHNIYRQQTALKLFETGVVFDIKDGLVHEKPVIAGLITGESGSLNWSEVTRSFDFFDLKGDVEAMLERYGSSHVVWKRAEHPALHPGQSAQIIIDDHPVGWLGVLHPRLMDFLDVQGEVVIFELDLMSLTSQRPKFQRISKYPQTRRDLSFLVDKEITAYEIETIVRQAVPAQELKAIDVFDVYVGETIPSDKKSLAIALTLQNDTRTLVEAEINAVVEKVHNQLNDAFSIILRD